MDTVGKNTKAIKEYIENQLKVDRESDQLSIYDPRDPFTGSMHGWQANSKTHLCVACNIRALPETEIPPRFAGGYLFFVSLSIRTPPDYAGECKGII